MRKTRTTLARETFRTSRLLEYFSEKELTLQTGHEPDRWPKVVVKELLDNALDACEEAGTLPDLKIEITRDHIAVEDNGPGIPPKVINGVLDYSVRTSSKDAYISPTRGQQGNALKTVVAIPYVLSGCESGEVLISSQGQRRAVRVSVDRIAQQPVIEHAIEPEKVKNGTRVEVRLACLAADDSAADFLRLVNAYHLFNPHGTFTLTIEKRRTAFHRTATTCEKWRASEPTSPHWYTAEQLRNLAAAYIAAERNGARPRTVREFVSEFRGLSGSAKLKTVLARVPKAAGVHLRDIVKNGDVDRTIITALLTAMRAESRPVKPTMLGVIGEAHLRSWLERQELGVQTVRYKRIADTDDTSGLPFVVEIAFAVRDDGHAARRTVITGINFAPTLVDPFRALDDYGISIDALLGDLHISYADPIAVVVHLTCPHLNYTDRGKSALEAL